jgi:phosphate acetyltransferase
MFDKHVDTKTIERKIIAFRSNNITPRMFQYQIVKRAKEEKKHIVLPEGDDDRILMAADLLIRQDVVALTILGIKENIEAAAKRLNLSLDYEKIKIINPIDCKDMPKHYANSAKQKA